MTAQRHNVAGSSMISLLRALGIALVLSRGAAVATAAEPPDTQAPDKYIEFVRGIAVQTALAETSASDVVKLLLLGAAENGEVLVLKIGLLTDNAHAHDADFSSGLDVAVIVHVHHTKMQQAPGVHDSLTVHHHGVPNIVIGSDGRQIWEVGVVAGKDVYREIGASHVGSWQGIESR